MTLSLITDRTLADVQRVKELAAIGWTDMTAEEQAEWLTGASTENLMASDGVLRDSNNEIITVIGGSAVIKGSYNYDDLNRVEGAVVTLAQQMQDNLDTLNAYLSTYNVAPDALFDFGYTVPTLVTKTDWDNTDFFNGTDAARYLGNIAALRDLIALFEPPPLPDDMDALTYEEANDIERLLLTIEAQASELLASYLALIDNTYPNFFYSAEINCGEV